MKYLVCSRIMPRSIGKFSTNLHFRFTEEYRRHCRQHDIVNEVNQIKDRSTLRSWNVLKSKGTAPKGTASHSSSGVTLRNGTPTPLKTFREDRPCCGIQITESFKSRVSGTLNDRNAQPPLCVVPAYLQAA